MPYGSRLESDVSSLEARAGVWAGNRGSMRTVPVNHASGPLMEGCEPLRRMTRFAHSGGKRIFFHMTDSFADNFFCKKHIRSLCRRTDTILFYSCLILSV